MSYHLLPFEGVEPRKLFKNKDDLCMEGFEEEDQVKCSTEDKHDLLVNRLE